MASTPESVAQQNSAIAEALKVVSSASELFQKVSTENVGLAGTELAGKTSEAHNALVLSAMKLLRTIQGPVDTVFQHFADVR